MLKLDSSTIWRVSVEAEGCWSDTASWTVHDIPRVMLHTFPAGEITGTFVGSAPGKKVITATLFPAAETESIPNLTEGSHPLRCTVKELKWSCRAPAAVPFDLRLDLPGYASVHYWSVVIAPATAHAVEPSRLRAGASITGWIHDAKGRPLAGANVLLTPIESEAADARARLALRRRTTTNQRGFFQFAGLPGDDYQIVSTVTGLSPAIVPLATVREGERLEWPRPIAHLPLAALEVMLDPPSDADGKPWTVELMEHTRIPATNPAPSLKRAASLQGVWSATGLRADIYRLNIRNSSDSIMERAWVDMSDGRSAALSVHVSTIRVEGMVTVGGQGLADAEVHFAHRGGKSVRVKTDEEGSFTTGFPTAGTWTVMVHYTIDDFRARVEGEPVEIPQTANAPVPLEITLPGGRLRGKVTLPDGTPVKAAVHVRSRTGTLVAQQVTSSKGAFEFLGMAETEYSLDAEGERGATAQPLPVQASASRSNELRVILEPYNDLRVEIYTPSGAPATGAVVELSFDQGQSWLRQAVGTRGLFRYPVPGGAEVVHLIVLTYAYPSALARIPMAGRGREPAVVRLQPFGGLLRVRGKTPYVLRDTVSVPLNAFFFPEPFGRFQGAIHLEPGPYAICPRPVRDSKCRDVVIAPHGETIVELDQ